MIYNINPNEYFNLYRSGHVPNIWRIHTRDGNTAIMQNYFYTHIQCALLLKHINSAFGVN